MTRQTFHCYCGFASDHPGTCPTCGDTLHRKASGQFAGVQQFHEQGDRAARLAVASFDHADVAATVVAEPQTRSKAALRESGPLADGFERGGIHDLPGVPESNAVAQQVQAVSGAIAQVALGGQFGELLACATDADQFAASAVGDENQLTGFDDGALLVVESGHLHSPVSGGASLRYDPYRNTVPVGQAQSHSVRRIFSLHPKRRA